MNKYDSEEIIHVKNGDLEYLQFKILNQHNVKNCITLKHGGMSKGEHESLNFRTLGTDKLENVLKNLDIISKELNFSNIHKGTQAHTDKVLILDENNEQNYIFENLNKEEVDGYITDKKEIATLITTADCNPIIIFDNYFKFIFLYFRYNKRYKIMGFFLRFCICSVNHGIVYIYNFTTTYAFGT